MRTCHGGLLTLALAGLAWPSVALALAEPRPAEGQLERLNAAYQKQLAELDRKHQADLIALAGQLTGPEADLAYQQAFELAIARDLYREAEPAALKVLSDSSPGNPRVRALAGLVNLVAKADRGAFDEALRAMESIVQRGPEQSPTRLLDPALALALGEAYVQRLSSGGRYDIARRACELITQRAVDPGVRDHFANRLRQFQLVGQPAPPIEGTDLDGQPVSLAALRGKRVLVDFWATWCPPCGPQMLRYADLLSRVDGQAFAIVGVNLDASAEGAGTPEQIRHSVRAFLAAHDASWPNLVASAGQNGPASAYHVTEIPSTFLISPDGLIEHVDVTPDRLESIVAAPNH